MRELTSTSYVASTYTDENTLYKNMLTEPVVLSMNLTHLYGTNNNQFPLLMLTEGQGQIARIAPKKESLGDTQYVWPIMGMMKYTSEAVRLADTSNTKPGLGFTPFKVVFKDNWFHDLYGAHSPDMKSLVRINGEPKAIGANEYEATMVIVGGNPSEYISLDNFLQGKFWVLAPTSVSASKSDGTTSNEMVPGKLTNQFGFQRYSKKIAGNISNKVVPYNMPLSDGTTTTKWMPFSMKLWELDRRMLTEHGMWHDKYNRNESGIVTLIDPYTNEPVPHGAGVKEIIQKFGYYDTYGPELPLKKINTIVDIIFTSFMGSTPDEIVIYGGTGARKKWHNAMMGDSKANQYFTALGHQEIQNGTNGFMTYGKYFDQYKTIHGKIITFKHSDFFDKGPIAQMQKMNGDMYDGLPIYSYTMVMLDHSADESGVRNIMMTAEQGREVITNVYKGMSPLPEVWKAAVGNNIATTKDVASYEVLTSNGICITKPVTSFWLDFML